MGRSPYRLYALSNVGSLAALFAYPFVVEPTLSSPEQGRIWSWLFVLFVVLSGTLALLMLRLNLSRTSGEDETDADGHAVVKPSIWNYLWWLVLPAVGSTALLAVTNQICQDVAVVPFLWVAPLSLYLLTFIICFDSERWYRPRITAVLALLAIGMICAILKRTEVQPYLSLLHIDYKIPDFLKSLQLELGLYLAVLFLVCMLCHGELVRGKPGTSHLTAFYLMIAAGGALGGVFVALICPKVFQSYREVSITLLAGALLASYVLLHWRWSRWRQSRTQKETTPALAVIPLAAEQMCEHGECSKHTEDALQSQYSSKKERRSSSGNGRFSTGCKRLIRICSAGFSAAIPIGVLAILAFVVFGTWPSTRSSKNSREIAACRSFYGVLRVVEWDGPDDADWRRLLYNGRILHGLQFLQPNRQREACTYYHKASGIGLALNYFSRIDAIRVGTIGLGSGAISVYGRKNDLYRFYEINPQVIDISKQYFTYLKECPADVDIIPGDARLSLEHETPQNYHVLAIAAFSGDAIPAHLLTVEAFGEYLRHLRPEGVIAVHTSNRHLNLVPIVALLADHYKMRAVEIDAKDDGGVGDAGSQWVLVTRHTTLLENTAIQDAATRVTLPGPEIRVWTDKYSNLFHILR